MMEQFNQWVLVMTKPQMEPVAYDNLSRQGYELYLPYWSCLKKTAWQMASGSLTYVP